MLSTVVLVCACHTVGKVQMQLEEVFVYILVSVCFILVLIIISFLSFHLFQFRCLNSEKINKTVL